MSPLTDKRTNTTYRGSYRGRASYVPRGRGRGGRGGSSRSLDLRPKSILVPGIVGTDNESAIREWIVMNASDAICESPAEDSSSMIIKFKERYQAEDVYSLDMFVIVAFAESAGSASWTVDGKLASCDTFTDDRISKTKSERSSGKQCKRIRKRILL
jgi:hypothetical protein